jgi:hypothetical protein
MTALECATHFNNAQTIPVLRDHANLGMLRAPCATPHPSARDPRLRP